MNENVIRICDYERRSREPDAAQPRNTCEADVIAFPVQRSRDVDFFDYQVAMMLSIAAAFSIPSR